MEKSKKISLGLAGLALLYFGFNSKSYASTDANTGTENILNTLDENLAFSTTQTKTLLYQIQTQGGKPIEHIQVRTWKGLVQLDLEGQETDKGTLNFQRIEELNIVVKNLFLEILANSNRALSSYCKKNAYIISDRIYTIETNLVNLSKLL